MPRITAAAAVTAIVYTDSRQAAAMLRRVAQLLEAAGVSLAGFVQHDVERPGRSRCDMQLANLATGDALPISQDRGPGARGCRLDADGLMRALVTAERALAQGPALLILNKFGKTEAEGGGFRPLIAEAIAQEVPVLLGVPWRNIDSWRAFAGEMGIEIDACALANLDGSGTLDRLGLVLERLGTPTAPGGGDEPRPV